MENKPQQNPPNRRKALYWLSGALSALVFWKLGVPKRSDPPQPRTVKMLTEDGQLVEIDEKFLGGGGGQKVSTEEIQHFITHKK